MSTSKDTVPGLNELVDRLISADGGREIAYAGVLTALKNSIQMGEFDEAGTAIRRVATADLDYTAIQSLSRLYRKCRAHCQTGLQPLKLAVLSSSTTTQLVEFIELFLFAGGVAAEVYEADFGLFRQEIIDPNSNFYRFAPGAIYIATHWRDLTRLPSIGDDAALVDALLAAEQAEWSELWRMAHDRAGCQIIQNNFDHPLWRQLGNHEMRHPASHGQFITRMNQSFQQSAPPFVTLHDIDGLSSSIGRRNWGDERFFHHAKIPCAPEHLVEYAHSVASVLLAQVGMSKKCLVLDLDNTLWGGVIGDDGLGGICLGQGDAEGEAFLAFQRYVRKLSERGVILAVCSKNNESVAREAFEKHPEMFLQLSDISCFVANWDDKAANIRSIARQLNIGLNSLVFVDDNPAERAIVRKLLPEVAVPEVGTDPVDFITALERNRYFQLVVLGKEDLNRTSYYLANAERQQTASSAESIESFLQSLEMVAKVGPINDMTLERSTQLINKSNQFNLTTIRRSAAEVQAIAKDPNWVTLTASLRDRFGDNGLISVILARVIEDAMEIDTWLMSCRVLKRNVEQMLLNELCTIARCRRLRILRGRYIATPKNELVKDHYLSLGFRTIAQDESRRSYELEVDRFQPIKTYIAVEKQK
jgi:FkbH-like protein